MADPRALVQRWAERCSGDPDRLVEEIYAPGAVSYDLAQVAPPERARDALAADERRFAIRVPDRQVVVVRSLGDGTTPVVVEYLTTGRAATDVARMVAPGMRWWELDEAGRVAREWTWSGWDGRRLDELVGDRPPAERAAVDDQAVSAGPGVRSQAWYRAFAARLAETRSWDPELSVAALYAPDASVEWPGSTVPPARGWAEIEAVERALASAAGGGGADTVVEDVVGDGPMLAVRLALVGRCPSGLTEPLAAGRWVAVLTLDDSDRIVSDRRYGPAPGSLAGGAPTRESPR